MDQAMAASLDGLRQSRWRVCGRRLYRAERQNYLAQTQAGALLRQRLQERLRCGLPTHVGRYDLQRTDPAATGRWEARGLISVSQSAPKDSIELLDRDMAGKNLSGYWRLGMEG